MLTAEPGISHYICHQVHHEDKGIVIMMSEIRELLVLCILRIGNVSDEGKKFANL